MKIVLISKAKKDKWDIMKMKVLAAHRAGLAAVVLPKRNEADLDELPDDVREAMTFITVQTIDEVLQATLVRP